MTIPVVGVVAEYDPFHNGHALHLARTRAAEVTYKRLESEFLSACQELGAALR